MNSTSSDPILADLYRFREEHAARHNYDVGAMVEELIREQEELEKQGRRFASYPPRRCRTEFPYTPLEEETPLSVPPIKTLPLTSDSASSSPSS